MVNFTVNAIASLGLISVLNVGVPTVTGKAVSPVPTHAIRGVVKSISYFYVVIVTGSGKKAREMTFDLVPSTERGGNITIGATVSVRYRIEGRKLVATAVSAPAAKQSAAQISR
jgi:hypothetical protein